ncbi:LysR family transcriptional regulator (plasmid) [Phaeobacter inhibens]|uniref:LysR family transcriptional regulator n=1 Tax=Phaeobacter inhibens TaxID=221822 RepID=UPI0021A9580C|nr:LysR family transcriptional regulator [Phaeobacter inhibens]UWR78259.1 LysR family transcriptional regulator [Phaeobacter inhibens]
MIDKISDLKLFMRIAESGSLSAAAKEFRLTPSAVSQRLAAIERELGVVLVRRSTRSQCLTHEGVLFLNSAKIILRELDAVGNMMSLQDSRNVGLVKVGTSVDLGRKVIVNSLNRFQEENLGINVELSVNDSFSDITKSGIDLAIRIGPLPNSELRVRQVARNFRIPVASPSYLNRCGHPLHPYDLKFHNCLTRVRSNSPNHNWCFLIDGQLEKVRVKGDRCASNGDLLKVWALSGKGILYKTIWTVVDEIKQGKLVPILTGYWGEKLDLQIVYEKGIRKRLSVEALYGTIFQDLRSLNAECDLEIKKIFNQL